MRFLTADYLYPLNITPIKEGVLQISNKGEIINIFKDRDGFYKDKLEFYEGILAPGFINAHCHLELSHLHKVIKKEKGLLSFIKSIPEKRNVSKKIIMNSIENAEKKMIKNGIVAVADTCNTSDTLLVKSNKNLEYYNFIETFAITDKLIDQSINQARFLRHLFRQLGLKTTITPHSPYSVHPRMMKVISELYDQKDHILSIHFQESFLEDQMFKFKKGHLVDWLKEKNADPEIWKSKSSSLDSLKDLRGIKKLLIHNTFSSNKNITDDYFCTCPKANLYIENRLPDYSIFNENKICVGTDSLASNNSLSILEELIVIQENSDYDLNTLLKIGCKNGAEILGFKELGTFEIGKKPGVNLIDVKKNLLYSSSKFKVLF